MFYILYFEQNKEPINFKIMCALDTDCSEEFDINTSYYYFFVSIITMFNIEQ